MNQTVIVPTPKDEGRNYVLWAARSTHDAIRMAEDADPALAAFLKGKSAIQSKALYGPILVGAVSWLSAHYGFGWDADAVNAVSGALAVVTGFAVRLLSQSVPITGVFKAAPLPVLARPEPAMGIMNAQNTQPNLVYAPQQAPSAEDKP